MSVAVAVTSASDRPHQAPDPTPGPAPEPLAAARWSAVACLALGFFVIVTSEILPIGLLDPMAAGFHVSAGTGGLLMTLPGLVAAVSAPAATVATARFDRRAVLAAFLAVLALANLAAALAPAFWLVLVGRALTGLVIGGYWSIGVGLAPRLVRAASVPTATALVFAAVPAGSVLGVPLGTLLGHTFCWRMPFAALCVLSGAVALALLRTLPPLPTSQSTDTRTLIRVLRSGAGARTGLLVTALIVVAHFGGYTYVAPFLRDTTGISESQVGSFLLIYGAAGIAGAVGAARALERSVRGTFAAGAVLIGAAALLLPVLGRSTIGALALLVVWGLAYGAIPACSKTWFTLAAPRFPEAAGVLFTASFQLTLALGALLGGRVVDAASASGVMVCAGGLALLAAVVVALVRTPGRAQEA